MNKLRFTFFILLAVQICWAQPTKTLSLNDFVTLSTFRQATVDGINSMNDGISYTSLVDGKRIVRYNYKTGQELETIFDVSKQVDVENLTSITSYTFSDNEQRILIETNRKPIYRRSYTATYYVWDRQTRYLTPLSVEGDQQVPSFSPDGERIAFVRDNNIYVKTLKFGTEYAVTTDGKFNEIINGVPDWVYEEEFSYNKAYEWSPDSKKLAFVKFDERNVRQFSMPMYKGLAPEMKENELYTGYYSFKYPKAGETNSEVTVYVHDVAVKSNIRVKTGDDTNIYIPRIKWEPSSANLAVFYLNRLQNELSVLYANPFSGDTRRIHHEKNNRFIDESFFDFFIYLPDNQHFVTISEADGWAHLYLYKNTGIKVKQLTKGNFDVTDFYGYDPQKKIFYYQAAKQSPLQREVYALTFDGKKDIKLSEKNGTNKAVFSKNFSTFINFHSNSKLPLTVAVNDANGKEVRAIETNAKLTEKLSNYILPSHEFFTFKTSEGIELNGYMLKPSNFDAAKKYPVVMTQYSGPNSQEVKDEWEMDWHYYLAELGYVVVCVDPRGTAARGEEFRKCTYMQLGKLESDDMVEAARYLGQLSFVNKDKIGIWGWSYGGFMAALCMEKGNAVFNTGISVAPVTNWRFYDTVYTERYMRTPQENPSGYDDNSPITHAKDIKGNYLLVHGTADDNVHAQNSYEFAEAMVQSGVQFDMMLYTNRNHGIYGGNSRMHLFTKIINYFDSNLK